MRCRTARLGNCATTTTSTTQSTTAYTGSTVTTIKPSFKVPDVLNCNNYFTFQGTGLVKQTCPSSSPYYNCWQGACSSTKSPYCCSSLVFIPGTTSCSTNGAVNGMPLNCMGYYECVNNKLVRKWCPNFQAFDVWSQTCKSPLYARCSIKPGLTVCKAQGTGALPGGSLNFNVSITCPKW